MLFVNLLTSFREKTKKKYSVGTKKEKRKKDSLFQALLTIRTTGYPILSIRGLKKRKTKKARVKEKEKKCVPILAFFCCCSCSSSQETLVYYVSRHKKHAAK